MTLDAQEKWRAIAKNPELWGSLKEFCQQRASEILIAQDEDALSESNEDYGNRVMRVVQLTAQRHVYAAFVQEFNDAIQGKKVEVIDESESGEFD